jgi:hypothetical protein
MIGVAQNHAGADLLEIARRQRLDHALCANRHEDRRADVAVRRGQHTASCLTVSTLEPEHQGAIIAAE